MTLTRRSFLLLGTTLAVLAATGLPSAYAQGEAGAQSFVKSFADELVGIVNGPGSTAQKQQALLPVIDRNVDVATIARFCLGRFWNGASPTQQQQYVGLFHQVLLNNISGHLGDYQGVSYQLTGTHVQGSETLVGTTISRPQQSAIDVQWVVSDSSGTPKVVDLVAEGSSMRLTQRQDYASYLSRHGFSIDALIAALKRQLASGG